MSTFEIVRGVEGDCLVLDDTRICGPKPWGGGRIIKTFRTDGIYEVIDKEEYRKLMADNAKLRELVDGLRYCAHEAHGMCARVPVGGERPFTCCPLYDFDSKEYRCEKLMRELGIEVSE